MTDHPVPPVPQGNEARADAGVVGIAVFLAALTVFFAASLAAYGFVRSRSGTSWLSEGESVPPGLWLSTLIILGGSAAIQWASSAAKRQRVQAVKAALWVTLGLGLCFLSSQTLIWLHLWAERAAAHLNLNFFYVLTGLHALHVAGGLVAVCVALAHIGQGRVTGLGVRLAAYYWHFLDLVWLAMLAVLVFSA